MTRAAITPRGKVFLNGCLVLEERDGVVRQVELRDTATAVALFEVLRRRLTTPPSVADNGPSRDL